jgi:hypothetical protein
MPRPSRPVPRSGPKRSAILTLSATLAALCALVLPSVASASRSQIALIQDGPALMANPAGTLATFRELGANAVRVVVFWSEIAPDRQSKRPPAHFQASDPNAYPSAGWAIYDTIVRDAQRDGIKVDLTLAGGAPRWAEGSGIPTAGNNLHFAWKPNASDYGQFVRAVGTRYSGNFAPPGESTLPAVHFWAVWNEPNFGQDLGPQAIDGSSVSVAPAMYRGLVDAGWSALEATGHQHDTILIGEFAARGLSASPSKLAPQGYPGDYGQTKPLQFIRTLYCVDSRYEELRGAYAKARGCPTSAAASRHFRADNPGLFAASGVGDHPYPDNGSPVTDGREPDFATFPELGNLALDLDRVNQAYRSSKKYEIYNDEYGYITHPPASARYVSPQTAAYYINWAEYLSWKNPRIASYMQYLLYDPGPSAGPYAGFASGLLTYNGTPKPTFNAYRLPIYLPKTSFSAADSAEVWGDARPAPFMARDGHGPQSVAIQFQPSGHAVYDTVRTVEITQPGGYFDLRLKFASSGNVRLAYTYPSQDAFLPVGVAGTTVTSRSVAIKVH